MADFFVLTKDPLPATLHGTHGEYSIRTLADRERISIEDFFSKREIKLSLSPETTAVVIPQSHTSNATLEDIAILIEFGLGVLSISGFAPTTIVAVLNATTCTDALQRAYQDGAELPKLPKKLVKAAASAA